MSNDAWQWATIVATCPKCGGKNHYSTVKENLEISCYATHCKHCRWGFVVVLNLVRCLACQPFSMGCAGDNRRVQVDEAYVVPLL